MIDDCSTPQEIPIVIVGMGPTGLMLAAELQLLGVNCLVLGTSEMPHNESRALGFTPSTLEIFAHRDMLQEFGPLEHLAAVHFGGISITGDHLSSTYMPVMRFPQHKTESVLRSRAERFNAIIRPGYTVSAIRDKGGKLETVAENPTERLIIRSQYVVGCDGSHSTVRDIASLAYSLTPPNAQMLLADIEHAGLPDHPFGKKTSTGMVMSGPISETIDRLIICDFNERPLERGSRVDITHLEKAYLNVTGDILPKGKIHWVSYFNDASGVARSFRKGKIFIAGDAAHTHLPAGGQGMNVSIQDAVNLGWKLAATVHGWAPEGLLDTYSTERHQAAAELIENTRAQGQVFLRGAEADPVRNLLERLFHIPEAASLVADEVTGLALRYPMGDDRPEPIGRLLPTKHIRLHGEESPPRGLLRSGRGLYLTSGNDDKNDAVLRRWKSRVNSLNVNTPEGIDLLIRPDGYVAWTSDATEPISDALERWFGSGN